MEDNLQNELQLAYETQVELNLVEPPDKVKYHLDKIRSELLRTTVHDVPNAQLIIKINGQIRRFDLIKSFAIGADGGNELQLESEYISGRHCQVIKDEESWRIEDLESRNGVYVNGKKIKKRYLCDGDIIQICNVTLVFFR